MPRLVHIQPPGGGDEWWSALICRVEFSVMCLKLFDLSSLVLQSTVGVPKLDLRLDLFGGKSPDMSVEGPGVCESLCVPA